MSKVWGFVLVLLALAVCASAVNYPSKEFTKQLAGPPEEFSLYKEASPTLGALRSNSAFTPVILKQQTAATSLVGEEGSWEWEGNFPVDSDLQFTISILAPPVIQNDLNFYVQPPIAGASFILLDDKVIGEQGALLQKTTNSFGIGLNKLNATSYIIPEPQVGQWNFRITTKKDLSSLSGLRVPGSPVSAEKPHLYLLFGVKSEIKVLTHLNTYSLELGEEVGLVARLYDVSQLATPESEFDPANLPNALSGAVVSAEMDVIMPNGREVDVVMHDDGFHYDLEAGDGVFGAIVEMKQVGSYQLTAQVKGTTPSGHAFLRTTTHSFTVVPPEATLTGLAFAEFDNSKNVVQFYVDVDLEAPQQGAARVKAYAEVWGTDASGLEYVPVAWVQAMVTSQDYKDGRQVVNLQLDTKWLQLAGAKAPFQLRNVQLQEPNTNNPISSRSEIFVELSSAHANALVKSIDYTKKVAITEEMRLGPRPASLSAVSAADDGKLVLVHGYCAGENPFPLEDFTNAIQFNDLSQSRSHDEFALLIRDFTNGLSSFSTVSHSQGGMATLHLFTYYWSALDANGNPGRALQSVGTPYQGTPLAGLLADIGAIIGIGCGGNVDLTRDGAANWLSKIPAHARTEVYYYTTQYDDYWWILPNDCVTAANLILDAPNDGTTETRYGQLSGANKAGHTLAWCHTGGMKYPDQCADPERNAEMNAAASR